MEDLKIRVKNEAESKEAQELFFKLGYGWFHGKSYFPIGSSCTHLTAYTVGMQLAMGVGDAENEITLPELRDLAVLHRNDKSDATHSLTVASDRHDYPIFKSSKGFFYSYSENNSKWVKCESINNTTAGLKLIQNKEKFLTNLDNGNYLEIDQRTWGDDQPIPKGATFATLENGMLVFRKDGYFWEPHDIIASDGGPEWVESSVTINNATACNLNVVWKQITRKEYLNTSTHKAEIFINPPTPAEEWLEIPEGATFATGCVGIVFRKDGFYWRDNIFMKEKNEAPHWQSTAVTQNCIPPMMSVIWTRNTESLNDIAKTAEDHRKKLIAAGRQTGKTEIIAEHLCPELGLSDFGTGILEADTLYHYSASYSHKNYPKDGVIAFDGRISSKADYKKIRELIFADMNENLKKPLLIQPSISNLIVHSLTVVG